MKRIDFLDGLRGCAILSVIFFHAFSRWDTILPYGYRYAEFPIFKFGYLGVELFFLISGFVILMSLERTKNFFQFIYKRWLRLFPAMLVVTIIVFFSSGFLHERPAGLPQFSSTIPGLIFTEPDLISGITGQKVNPLEGTFWSLFVEFEFYIIFGILFFWLGRSKAIAGIFLLSMLSIFKDYLLNIHYADSIRYLPSFRYFGWFASGSLAYLFYLHRQNKYLIYAMIAGAAEITKTQNSAGQFLFSIVIFGIFITSIYFEKLRFILRNKFLLFFGFISYPLYLIHENAMVAMIIKLNKNFEKIPDILLPVLPIIILCLVSYLIAKIAEPSIKKLIQQIVYFFQQRIGKKQTDMLS